MVTLFLRKLYYIYVVCEYVSHVMKRGEFLNTTFLGSDAEILSVTAKVKEDLVSA